MYTLTDGKLLGHLMKVICNTEPYVATYTFRMNRCCNCIPKDNSKKTFTKNRTKTSLWSMHILHCK